MRDWRHRRTKFAPIVTQFAVARGAIPACPRILGHVTRRAGNETGQDRSRPDSHSLAMSRYLFTWTCMKLSLADVLTTRIVVPVLGTFTPDQPK